MEFSGNDLISRRDSICWPAFAPGYFGVFQFIDAELDIFIMAQFFIVFRFVRRNPIYLSHLKFRMRHTRFIGPKSIYLF